MSLPTKPGNAERGWNDPPVFLHTSDGIPVTGSAPPKRSLLNKRVAHTGLFGTSNAAAPNTSPTQSADVSGVTSDSKSGVTCTAPLCPPPSAGDTGQPGGIVLLPPTTTTDVPKYVAPIIVPNMSPTDETNLPIVGSPTATNPVTNTQINIETEQGMPNFDDDQQMFHYVVSKLQKTLLDVKGSLQPRTVDDVKKKLDILSGMWESGRLSYPVKSSMARLSTALHNRQCDEAHKIHMALMMDSVSEVGQWMVGVKRLIQEARTHAPPAQTTPPTGATSTAPAHTSTEIVANLQNSLQDSNTDDANDQIKLSSTQGGGGDFPGADGCLDNGKSTAVETGCPNGSSLAGGDGCSGGSKPPTSETGDAQVSDNREGSTDGIVVGDTLGTDSAGDVSSSAVIDGN